MSDIEAFVDAPGRFEKVAQVRKLLPSRMRNLRANGHATYLPDSGNTEPVSLPIAVDVAR